MVNDICNDQLFSFGYSGKGPMGVTFQGESDVFNFRMFPARECSAMPCYRLLFNYDWAFRFRSRLDTRINRNANHYSNENAGQDKNRLKYATHNYLLFLAIIASISSGSFVTFDVRLRLPSSVTRTSSSMRMPIPRYFAGAVLSSGGT